MRAYDTVQYFRSFAPNWYLPFCDVPWKPLQKLHVLSSLSSCKQTHQLVLPLLGRDVVFIREKREKSFSSSENFLESECGKIEAKWSPNAIVRQGLRCPFAEWTNNITIIRPPWLKKIFVVDEKGLFCLCSVNAFYFTAQNKSHRMTSVAGREGYEAVASLCKVQRTCRRERKLNVKICTNIL